MYMPRRIKKWGACKTIKKLDADVYGDFILKCKTLGITLNPSTGKWINTLWHIHSWECYLAIRMKRKEGKILLYTVM